VATFICKMCSGPLELVDEGKFAKCTYCGTMYTLPLDDDVTAEQMIKARPIFEKAKMYLEDGRFDDAAYDFERVLDIIPSFGEAYLGKGLAQLQLKDLKDLTANKRQALKNYYIQKALTFCVEPLRSELMSSLGLISHLDQQSRSLLQWRTKVLNSRKSFVQELRNCMQSHSPEYDEAVRFIEEKYNKEAADIKAALDRCDADIHAVKNAMNNSITGNLMVEKVTEADEKIQSAQQDKRELMKKLSEVNGRRLNAMSEIAERFPDHKETISQADFQAIVEKHPLPQLLDNMQEGILDKLHDILLSCHDYQSLIDILQHPQCQEMVERRVEAALKKLIYEKRITSITVNGTEYYAPVDMTGIVIE